MLLLVAPLAGARADDAAQKTQELNALRKTLEAARTELSGLSAQRSEEVSALRRIETRQAEAARALHDATESLERQQAALERLQARRATLEDSVTRGREALATSVRALYLLGPDSGLPGLLSPGGRADKMRLERYLAIIRERHAQTLKGLRDDLDESTRVAIELETGLAHLKSLEEGARDEQARLSGHRARQDQAIQRLEARVKEGETRVEQMREDQRVLAVLVNKLEEAARQPPPAQPREKAQQEPAAPKRAKDAKGEPRAPVASVEKPATHPQVAGKGAIPVDGRLVRKFGESTGLGELRSDGHFYATAEGAPVRAVANGRVVFADWMSGFGQLVILQHAGGYLSLYAHNEAIYKGLGASVRRGEVIGASGRSGGTRQTGLYFEVRRNGKPINPARWSAMTKK